MSTAVATETARPAAPARLGKLSFPHLLRSEWIKFWSVRSTIWTLAIFLLVTVGLIVLISLAFINAPSESQGGPPASAAADALGPFTVGVTLGQFYLDVMCVV